MLLEEDLASLINKPIIKAEDTVGDKKRIDILVYEEGKYAIVFENKIWDAEEQENQLANYINGMRTKEYGLRTTKSILFISLAPMSMDLRQSRGKSLCERPLKKDIRVLASKKELLIGWNLKTYK